MTRASAEPETIKQMHEAAAELQRTADEAAGPNVVPPGVQRVQTMLLVNPNDLEGIITFPSFHVAGGLMVTWAFRRYRRWCAALALLNIWLIAATVMTGAHYVVDVLATFALFPLGVWLWRRVACYWIDAPALDAPAAAPSRLSHGPAA